MNGVFFSLLSLSTFNLNKPAGDPPELAGDNPASVPVMELGGNGGWNRWREREGGGIINWG